MIGLNDENSFHQTWFMYDGDDNPGEGAVVVVFYCYLNTQIPRFSYSMSLTEGSKGIIN